MLCSEILVRYGMDVNAMDHNNNTALDYLAWNLDRSGIKFLKVALPDAYSIVLMASYLNLSSLRYSVLLMANPTK